jgi:hypothetical protein
VRISSLRGESTLFNRLCPSLNMLELSYDFLIEGASFDKAVTSFARRVLAAVFSLGQHEQHYFLALHIGTAAPAVRAVPPSAAAASSAAASSSSASWAFSGDAADAAAGSEDELAAAAQQKSAAALAGEPIFEGGVCGIGGVRTQLWSIAQCQVCRRLQSFSLFRVVFAHTGIQSVVLKF